MKVLFVCPFVPWPLVNGGKIRTFHLARSAARHAEIHMRILEEPSACEGVREALEPWCASVEFFERSHPGSLRRFVRPKLERWFHSRALHEAVRRDLAGGSFHLLHLDELLLARIANPDDHVPVVQHHHKLDTVLYHTLAENASPANRFDLWKLRRLEAESTRRYRHHILCSQGDADILCERHGALDVEVIPSGFDVEAFQPSQPAVERVAESLLFLGSMDYAPNADGVRWFVQDVLPRIRDERPGVRLDIVGGNPSPEVRALERPGVRVVGRVPSVLRHLEEAAAMVVPLRIGGGTRLKIVEALAAGTPVISTTTGAEGLGLVHGEHLELADDAATFARGVLTTLGDPPAAASLATRGRAFVEEHYRWDVLGDALVEYWERVAFSGKRSPSR